MSLIKSSLQLLSFLVPFTSIFLCNFSCSSKQSIEKHYSQEHSRETLRINLTENIQSLFPLQIKNRSEKLVANLIYDGLYNLNEFGQAVPSLIDKHSQDSISNTHTFELKPNVSFHNGVLLSTKHIYHCFKSMIDAENTASQSFRSNILGYNRYALRKTYKIGNDSLPSGFKIIDESSFSIQFEKPIKNLKNILTRPDFLIFDHYAENNIGTSKYILDYANGDISYLLKKNKIHHSGPFNGPDVINIRFIKNKDAALHEFMNGSLDLIVREPSSNSSQLDINMLDAKYGKFNKYESSKAVVTHLSLHNISSSINKNLILNLLNAEKNTSLLTLNRLNKRLSIENFTSSPDSIGFYKDEFMRENVRLRIPIVVTCKYDCIKELGILKESLSQYFDLQVISKEQINPNLPYLVLEESEMSIYGEKPRDQEHNNALSIAQNNPSLILTNFIVNYERETIISNIMLKGLSPYTNWEESLQNLYFTEPKKY